MTCIAIKKVKGGFEIAADSQTSWGGHKFPTKENNTSFGYEGKLFEVNEMTIGCAGSVSNTQMLAIYAKSHKPKDMNTDDILDWFVEFKFWAAKKFDIKQDEISLHCIIHSRKKAFTVFDFLECHEVKEFDAVGSGMFLAIGAMDVGASAEDAVNVAIKYDKHCGFNTLVKHLT
jgi:ATP-dependent protease HslVU (ClpYQ) peptidase subunit